jgi:hypothetical protein
MDQETKHKAPMTDHMLTEKLELDIEKLIVRWLGLKDKISSQKISQNSVISLLADFGVLNSYVNTDSAAESARFNQERSFCDFLWLRFLVLLIDDSCN